MKNMFPEITKSLINFRKIIESRYEYEDSLDELDGIIKDSTEPLLVMIMGEFSTGKSTFINALVGEKIAAVNATPTTAVITKLCYGGGSKVIVHYKDGSQEENPNIDFANLTSENRTKFGRYDEISFVERFMPCDMLKSMSIIDSPGLNSMHKGHTVATKDFVNKADAVIWMFDANKPVSQTEISAMSKLNPRLQPIAIVNKMDSLNDDEDDEESFLDGIRKKLKDKVKCVIGISAKWAFMGKVNGNEKQIIASNIQEFYQKLDELILPNIKTYKMNTLIDDMTEYILNIWDRIEAGEAIVSGLQEEDYASYMEERERQVILRDALDEMLIPFHEYAKTAKKKNASAQVFFATLYHNGILVEKNETLAKQMAEEAALRNDELAQAMLAIIYINESIFDRALYWGQRLVKKESAAGMLLLGKMYQAGIGVDENAEEAVKFFEKAVEQEDGDGIYQLACCYLTGHGVTKDDKKALELLDRGVKEGSTEAMVALGNVYKEGELVPKDEKKAFELYERAARKGDVDGQAQLAVCYFYGEGTEENDDKAVYWMRRAAMQDAPDPQSLMGFFYKNGYGVPQNKSKAIMWLNRAVDNGNCDAMLELLQVESYREKAFSLLRKAAESGDSKAQLYLGNCYSDGNYVEEDKEKAMTWYQKSASQGNATAMNSIGNMYNNGIGVSEDYKEAMRWYRQSAESGNPEGMFHVGVDYGMNQNSQEATKWIMKAAELGYVLAMYVLGGCYFKGDGVEKNYDKALKWYMKAADEGLVEAMHFVGTMYKDGVGVSRDVEQAKKWFVKAAEMGYSVAMRTLGDCYLGGVIEKNYDEALKWYMKAADEGDAESMDTVGRMYIDGAGVSRDVEQARKWLQMAADNGNVHSMFTLGVMYIDGDSGSQDAEQAKKWLQMAADNGDEYAAEWLEKIEFEAKPEFIMKVEDYFDIKNRGPVITGRIATGVIRLNDDAVLIDENSKIYHVRVVGIEMYRKLVDSAVEGDDVGILLSGVDYKDLNTKLCSFLVPTNTTYSFMKAMTLMYKYEKVSTETEIEKFVTEDVENPEELLEKGYTFDKAGDYRQAMHFYQKAASAGNDYAAALIGDMYHEGRGVNKDYDEALKWLKKAADNGNAEAMSSIANMYYKGDGVKVDFKVAANWWTRASSHGDAMAKNNLAYLYEKGYGVQQSTEKAIELYKTAAAEGVQEAQAGVERLTKKSGCFITTAVCTSFNKPDDCYELTMFRKFRDEWLITQPNGESLINEYYRIAPLIVKCINLKENSNEIYKEIWKHYLRPCLFYIELGENIRCKDMYVAMVNSLRKEFLCEK